MIIGAKKLTDKVVNKVYAGIFCRKLAADINKYFLFWCNWTIPYLKKLL